MVSFNAMETQNDSQHDQATLRAGPVHGEDIRSLDLARVPQEPGCYLMRDKQDTPIYVGKAANLRARIRTYIAERDDRPTVKFLLQRAVRVEFIVTRNEKEALLLEDSLIKQYRPRYNIRLRDDKTYVSVRVNIKHPFPRITATRKLVKDGSRYFGPYASALAVRETLKQLQRIFPLRTCSDTVLKNRTRPCIYYEIGQCSAPCVGKITEEAYREIVKQAIMALEGRRNDVESLLLEEIRRLADRLEFEKAAVIRDRLKALRDTFERQYAVRSGDVEDRDVFGVYQEGRYCVVHALYFRAGRIVGSKAFSFARVEIPVEEMLSSFLLQFYRQDVPIPHEILIPFPLEDQDTLQDFLSEERGSRVSVHCPQRGDKRKLIELAERNAKNSFEESRLRQHAQQDLLDQARQVLGLFEAPERIECFDISTVQGDKPVGAMSVFVGGVPDKTRYRHYAIRHIRGQDDFAMLREVLLRRLQRAVEENDLPSLLLIDGGKGQLNVAITVLRDLGLEDLPVISIAKARPEEKRPGATQDRLFLPNRKDPLVLAENDPVLHLFMRIRDEAHRFAVSYHRKRRTKGTLRTVLDDVPGLGKKRVQALLKAFGSLERVRAATCDEIAAVPGFGKAIAEQIKQYLETLGEKRSENMGETQ